MTKQDPQARTRNFPSIVRAERDELKLIVEKNGKMLEEYKQRLQDCGQRNVTLREELNAAQKKINQLEETQRMNDLTCSHILESHEQGQAAFVRAFGTWHRCRVVLDTEVEVMNLLTIVEAQQRRLK